VAFAVTAGVLGAGLIAALAIPAVPTPRMTTSVAVEEVRDGR
jgi:hypothetical protein